MATHAKTKVNHKTTKRPTGVAKRLTLSEKILIRAEKGSRSVRVVAKAYGVTPSTVQRLWGDIKLANMEKEVNTVKAFMSGRLYVTADQCVDQVQAALPNSSSKDAAIAMDVCIKNARLIDNESTANVGVMGFLDLVNDIPVI